MHSAPFQTSPGGHLFCGVEGVVEGFVEGVVDGVVLGDVEGIVEGDFVGVRLVITMREGVGQT